MSSPKRTAEDVIRERRAAKERATKARMAQEREVLNKQIEELKLFFETTTQAALERLERKGFPGGKLYKFSDYEDELAAWELPQIEKRFYLANYCLASDGTIRSFEPFCSRGWKTHTVEDLRDDVLFRFGLMERLDAGTDEVNQWTSIIERCNLICPDELDVTIRQPWWKRIFA